MSQSIRIPVERLRAACALLVDHLARIEGDVIELERDYFWSINDEALYDVYQEPESLGIGQVSESWAHVERLLDGEVDVPTRHVVWLSDVLRAIGMPITRKPRTGR